MPASWPELQASASLPGTCGELFQGTVDGVYCLVSCPIARFSRARVVLRQSGGWRLPQQASKAIAALRALLAQAERQCDGGELALESDLPRSRGYGSSTADLGATLYAASAALGHPLSPARTVPLAVAIEPSDSTLVPGLALLDHRHGTVWQPLGAAPSLSLLVVDPGGEVDTLAFNAVKRDEALRPLRREHAVAFTLLSQGLADGHLLSVGEAATLSARVHQAILHNPLLEQVCQLGRQLGAVGVCRAHSGTILGLLFDPDRTDLPAAEAFARRKLAGLATVSISALVDGGPRLVSSGQVMEQA